MNQKIIVISIVIIAVVIGLFAYSSISADAETVMSNAVTIIRGNEQIGKLIGNNI